MMRSLPAFLLCLLLAACAGGVRMGAAGPMSDGDAVLVAQAELRRIGYRIEPGAAVRVVRSEGQIEISFGFPTAENEVGGGVVVQIDSATSRAVKVYVLE